MMKIVVTGGGTYGHVGPLDPLSNEIKSQDETAEIIYIGKKKDRFADLLESPGTVDRVYKIHAGKYRRYPDETTMQRILDFHTHFLNTRDLFYSITGLVSAMRILRRHRPDVVFGNGGFVSVPVGIAASILKIPIVIHESDSKPGVANKILASKASRICLGMPIDNNKVTAFDPEKTTYTGIPTRPAFLSAAKANKQALLKKLQLKTSKALVVVSGGSLGAEAINNSILDNLHKLLEVCQIVHITGEKHEESIRKSVASMSIDAEDYHIVGFTTNIAEYFAASDLVITRASATTFSELSILGKPVLLIPAAQLSDQVENAMQTKKNGSAEVILESEIRKKSSILAETITSILSDKTKQKKLTESITRDAKPDSAKIIATMLLSYTRNEAK